MLPMWYLVTGVSFAVPCFPGWVFASHYGGKEGGKGGSSSAKRFKGRETENKDIKRSGSARGRRHSVAGPY